MINTALTFAKTGIQMTAGIGVGKIIGNVVVATTPADIGKVGKFLVDAGGCAISFVVCDMIISNIEEHLDSAGEKIKELLGTKNK